jgi:hypothetical protein
LKRLIITLATGLTLAGSGAATATASAAQPLPTLKLALSGSRGIAVSGSAVSGAVNVVSTFTGKKGSHGPGGEAALFRLNPGVTAKQIVGAVKHNQDPNAVTRFGAIVFDAGAPGSTQVVLAAGHYLALNVSGNGPGGYVQFTVAQSPSPAALPPAKAIQTAIDFAFRGPTVLHDGTVVRTENRGYVVHMVTAFGVRNPAAGRRVMALLRAGKDGKAARLANHRFFDLAGPLSSGAVQQAVLHAKPGWYVEACFMDTQDGREHTRLGMERLIRVVK